MGAIDDLEVRPTLHALRRLAQSLRRSDFKVTAVVVDDLLIDVEDGDTSQTRHAIAFDLGTTTVVATLLDLSTGTPVAVQSMLNRQQPHGADVISRISATMLEPDALPTAPAAGARDPGHAGRRRVRRSGDRPGAGLRGRSGRQRDDDRAGAGHGPGAAGGRAVRAHHRVVRRAVGHRPRPLAAPGRPCRVFPALGAYVGGDIVAGMLASGVDRDKRLRLFVDVGTNCEIVLGDGERIWRRRRQPDLPSRVGRSGAACVPLPGPSRGSGSATTT
jgi:hypothetical protein